LFSAVGLGLGGVRFVTAGGQHIRSVFLWQLIQHFLDQSFVLVEGLAGCFELVRLCCS
jgi:hypothetical protein